MIDVVGLEAVPEGRRAVGDAVGLAARGARGAGGRGALVRAREPGEGRAFDLYGDTRSQVYGGVDAESPPTSAAVDATKGQVVLYNGKVADTLLLLDLRRSHGVGARGDRRRGAVPRLGRRSVRHALAVPRLGPGARWTTRRSAKQLKLSAPISDLSRRRTARPAASSSVTVVSADDSQATLTGEQVRAALDLRSTWFTPALLALLPTAKTDDLRRRRLAHRRRARRRRRVARVEDGGPAGLDAGRRRWSLGADGAFSTIVKPQATTQYRLALGRRAGRPREDRGRAARRRDGRRRWRQRTIRPAVASRRRCSSSSKPARPGRPSRRRHRHGGRLELRRRAACRHLSRPLCAGPGARTRLLRNARRAVRRWRRVGIAIAALAGAGGGRCVRQHGAARGEASGTSTGPAPGRSGRRSRSSLRSRSR